MNNNLSNRLSYTHYFWRAMNKKCHSSWEVIGLVRIRLNSTKANL